MGREWVVKHTLIETMLVDADSAEEAEAKGVEERDTGNWDIQSDGYEAEAWDQQAHELYLETGDERLRTVDVEVVVEAVEPEEERRRRQ